MKRVWLKYYLRLAICLLTTSAFSAETSSWNTSSEPPNTPITFNEQMVAHFPIERRATDTAAVNSAGQSFRINEDIKIGQISIKLAEPLSIGPGNHQLKLALLKDTNANGIGDKLMGAIAYYDLANASIDKDQYIHFMLPKPLFIQAAYAYHFELAWTSADDQHSFLIWCSDEQGEETRGKYAGGHCLLSPDTNAFPLGEALTYAPSHDLTFFISAIPALPAQAQKTKVTNAPATAAPIKPTATKEIPIINSTETNQTKTSAINAPEATRENEPTAPANPFLNALALPAGVLILILLSLLKRTY